jgi:hypothetical protein
MITYSDSVNERTSPEHTPGLLAQEMEAALAGHVETMRQAFFSLLAAIVTIVLGIVTGAHAIIRIVYGLVGMCVWSCAVMTILLKMLHGYLSKRAEGRYGRN